MADFATLSGPGNAHPAFLRPGLHAVPIADDLVLLDTREDAYLCIPGLGGLEGRLAAPGPLRDALAAEGLLTKRLVSHPYPARTLPDLPSLPCRPTSANPIPPRQIIRLARLWLRLASRPMEIADLALEQGRRPSRPSDRAAVTECVETYRRLLPLFPWIGECLFQSRLLLAFLNANGLDAIWVFGVRLRPFAAHCWLQADDMALTDAPDVLAAYHPILAL